MTGSFERSKQWTQLNILMLIITILRLLPAVRGQAERAEDKSLSTRSQIRQKALAELDEQLQDLYSARDFAYGATGPESLSSAANHDWELRDIALVLTVDGELHAVKRSTGQHVWSLHDSSSGTDNIISQPLVAARSSYPNTSAVADQSTGQGLSSHANSSPPDQSDEVYILEPTAGGSIFVYSRSKQSTTKLPLTMAELVNLSPFTFPGDDSRMFVSQKTTSLVGVDLASGKLAGVFGPEAGWCEWQSNRNGMMDSDNEEGIQTRPRDLLYVGRTEYSLSILAKSTGALIQHLSYTSFHPSSISSASQQASYLHTPDDRYFQPMSDGNLVCFRTGETSMQWATLRPFASPVVGVFDIAYDLLRNQDPARAQPMLLKQPNLDHNRAIPAGLKVLQSLPDMTFVGKLPSHQGDSLYAMSKSQFPLVAVSHSQEAPETCEEGQDCLLGLHDLANSIQENPSPLHLLDEGKHQSPLGIDPPLTHPAISDRPTQAPSSFIPSLPDSVAGLGKPFSLSIAICLLSILCYSLYKLKNRIVSKPAQNGSLTSTPEIPSTNQSDNSDQRSPVGLLPSLHSDKELPPIPLEKTDESKGTDSADEDDAEGREELEGSPSKKKRGRRKRGKKPSQRNGFELDGNQELGLDEGAIVKPGQKVKVGSLSVEDAILGYGSHGTVVLKGAFQGRAVAVKRLLKHFTTIATHEVALLQESDEHPNVIRYFCKEQRDNFLYIALELCPASLADLIESPAAWPDLYAGFEPKRALKQIASGLAHLHKLKIVHRDIKPQNILVSPTKPSKKKGEPIGAAPVRMLISDFGLCRKLELDESSFQQTVNHAAGSFGYRAPEVLRGEVNPNEPSVTPSSSTKSTLLDPSDANKVITPPTGQRLTRSLDIFSLGCIFYYVLTQGDHPFGSKYEREMNILNRQSCLIKLDNLGEEAHEAQSMISSMIQDDPILRPIAETVILHPFFWTPTLRLNFLCEASDRFEIMERDPPDIVLVHLEASPAIVGNDWLKRLDKSLVDNLGKYRRYDGTSVRDLLRVIRNKKHHFLDLPDNVRKSLGSPPDEFLSYFTTRFPQLFLHVWAVVRDQLQAEALFASTYFRSPES